MDYQSYDPNNRDNEYSYNNYQPNKKPRKPVGKRIALAAVLVVAVLALAFAGLNAFYTIGEEENAVGTTFGVPETVTEPGLHFQIPFVSPCARWT